MILEDREGTSKCLIDPINGLLSKSDLFRLYRAKSLDESQSYLLRIPSDASGNGRMNYEASTLSRLKEISDRTEVEFAEQRKDPDARVHYDWLMPVLVDSFISSEDQGYRQMNLLSIVDGNIEDYVPLSKLIESYKIDVKSAAWVLGRFFKLQSFLEMCDCPLQFRADQVILDPQMHRVVYLDWSSAKGCSWGENIRREAELVLEWIKDGGTEHEDEFRSMLAYLADPQNVASLNGASAHALLYRNIDSWWGHKYHPFTYSDRKTGVWHQVQNAPIC